MSSLTISPKATSREACDQLLRLLSSFSQYNDDSVCELLRSHPETCTVKYNFGYGNMDVHPLFQLVFLQASMQAIHLAYQAHPFAIYEPDQNGNFPLHVACASRASLEVLVQLVEWLPWAVKSTNAAGRTPLHLACHRHATLPVIRFLVWKYPLSLVMRAKDGCTPREDAAKAAVHQHAPNMSSPITTTTHMDESGHGQTTTTEEEDDEAILLEFLEYAESELDMALLERRSALAAAVKEWKMQSQLYGNDQAFAMAATAQRHLTWMEPFLDLLPADDEDENIVATTTTTTTIKTNSKESKASRKPDSTPLVEGKMRAASPDPPTSSDPVVEAIAVAVVHDEQEEEEVSPPPPVTTSPETPAVAWSTNITVVEEEEKKEEEEVLQVPTAVTTKDLSANTGASATDTSASFNWCAITDALGWCPMAAVDEEPVLPSSTLPTTTTVTTTTEVVSETTIRDAATAISLPATTITNDDKAETNAQETGDWCSSLEALEDEILPIIPPATPPYKRKAKNVASPTNMGSPATITMDNNSNNKGGIVQLPPRTSRLVVVEDDTNHNCSSPIMFLENALSGVGLSPTPTEDDAKPPSIPAMQQNSKGGTATAPNKKEAAENANKQEVEADPIIYYESGEEKKESEPVYPNDEITPQVSNASFQMSPKSADQQEAASRSISPRHQQQYQGLLGDGTLPADNDLADFLASVGLQITNDGLVNPVLPPAAMDEEGDDDNEEYEGHDGGDGNRRLESPSNNDPPAQVISTTSKTFEDDDAQQYDEVEEERSHGVVDDKHINHNDNSNNDNMYEVSEEDMPEYNYNDEYHMQAHAAAEAAANAALLQAHREAEEEEEAVALSPRRQTYSSDVRVYASPGKRSVVSSPGGRSGSFASPLTASSPAEAFSYHTPTRTSRNGNNNNNSNNNTTTSTYNVMHREQMVRAWLLKYLPTLREEDLSVYANRLVDDGFDSVDMLENELMEEDLDFMRKAHKRSMGRKKFVDSSEGY